MDENNVNGSVGEPNGNNSESQYNYAPGFNGGNGGGFNQTPPPQSDPPGYGLAVASMVLGIIAVVLWFFGYSSLVSIILGVIGIVLASKSKSLGYEGAMRTAGFVLSIVAVAGGIVFFISCVACVGCIAGSPYLWK